MKYRLQFLDGSLWTTQGTYGSEGTAMRAMESYSRTRPGFWRVVQDDAGRITVLTTIKT